MRVGLIRHFRTTSPYMVNRWMGYQDYLDWLRAYEETDVHPGELRLAPSEWNRCFSSDLLRARKTAEAVFPGRVELSPLLREIPVRPPYKTTLRMPFVLWEIAARLAWYFSRTDGVETRRQTEARVKAFVDGLAAVPEANILAVSHAGVMRIIRQELLERGFTGERFSSARNGRLYIFEKTDARKRETNNLPSG
jgi:broad specificity phosphatase PhoE